MSKRLSVWLELLRDLGYWLGGLYYDREPELSFAEIELQDSASCPREPPWLPPRDELLSQP